MNIEKSYLRLNIPLSHPPSPWFIIELVIYGRWCEMVGLHPQPTLCQLPAVSLIVYCVQ